MNKNSINMPLATPPALVEKTLRVVPLGGLGEVGRNMSTVEILDPLRPDLPPQILILDCGVLFPGDDELGVDLILPDFSYISDRLQDVQALCITHAHEDHIGAIPFLLKLRPDIPLVGTKFTLEIVKNKLSEHRINPIVHEVKEGDELRFGPFLLNFLPVNHSIPDALAIFIKTAAGNVLDTGDFKMDQLPLDSRVTDLRAFSKAGEEGVDLFMVDSTNAHNAGFVRSESEIGPAIDRLFTDAPNGVIFATTFASHVHRVQNIINAAIKNHRVVAFLGRSMVKNMKVAMDLNKLHVPPGTVVDIKNVADIPSKRLCIVCTGSQGEQMAAVNRMADGEHNFINIEAEDTVIFASSLVPGNEKSVSKLQNKILTNGANVFSKENATVHCSGHAQKGELEYIYNVVRPKNVLPIHGETRHLIANAKIAQSTGVPKENTPTILAGGIVDIREGEARIVGRIENGYVFVDGRNVGTVSDDDLKHRRILSEEGFVAVSVTVDLDAKKVIAKPKVVAKAVAEDDGAFYHLTHKVAKAVEKAMNEDDITDVRKLSQVARRVVGRWVAKELRRSPMILPMVSAANETLV